MQELKEKVLACLSGLEIGESYSAEAISDEACITLKEAYDALDELLNERLVEQHAGIGKRDPTYTITKKGKYYKPGEAEGTSVQDEAPPKVKKPDVTPGRTIRGRPPGKGRKAASPQFVPLTPTPEEKAATEVEIRERIEAHMETEGSPAIYDGTPRTMRFPDEREYLDYLGKPPARYSDLIPDTPSFERDTDQVGVNDLPRILSNIKDLRKLTVELSVKAVFAVDGVGRVTVESSR